MQEIVGVKFKKIGKVYFFNPCGISFEKGQHAIVETSRGIEYGEVVSYNISRHPVFKQVTDMLFKAFEKIPNDTNLILHSDQGWQYQMKEYQTLLKDKGIRQSMSRKGNCLDNSLAENFFGLLKSELFYPNRYDDIYELEKDIKKYINYYNYDRIRLSLNGMSPIQYRTQFQLLVA